VIKESEHSVRQSASVVVGSGVRPSAIIFPDDKLLVTNLKSLKLNTTLQFHDVIYVIYIRVGIQDNPAIVPKYRHQDN
jgi:hypothetical protein